VWFASGRAGSNRSYGAPGRSGANAKQLTPRPGVMLRAQPPAGHGRGSPARQFFSSALAEGAFYPFCDSCDLGDLGDLGGLGGRIIAVDPGFAVDRGYPGKHS
jgi:hypothetical protein